MSRPVWSGLGYLYAALQNLLMKMVGIQKLLRGGRRLIKALYTIIKDSWENFEVSADWKDAQLVTIFKKGDRQNCGNYYGILFLSIPGKVLIHILLNRLSILPKGPWIWSFPCDKYKKNALNRISLSIWYLLTETFETEQGN